MKLYHGTNSEFNQFSLEYCGSNTEWENCSRGIHLTNEIGMAQLFGTNVLECSINVSKALDLDNVFNKSDQAPDIVKIIFQEEIDDPEEALEFLDESIGLGEYLEFKDCFNSRDTIEEFMALGYDHIIDRFAENKIEYCVFDPSKISILQRNIIDSKVSDDFVKILPLNSFQQENANKALRSKDQNNIDFVIKQVKKNIESIPNRIDGYELDSLSKLKILTGQSSDQGQLSYSVKGGLLYRTLEDMSMVTSPVLRESCDLVPRKNLKVSL